MPSAKKSGTPKFRFRNIGPVKEAEFELGDLTLIAGGNNTGKTYLVYTLYGFLKGWRGWPEAIGFLAGGDGATQADPMAQALNIGTLIQKVMEEGQAKHTVDRKTLGNERKAVMRALTRSYSEQALAAVFSSPSAAFEDASIEMVLSHEFPQSAGFFLSDGRFSLRYDGHDVVITRESGVEKQLPHFFTAEFDLASLYLQFLFPELSLVPFVLSSERFGISLFYKELDFTKNRLVDLLQKLGDAETRQHVSPFLLIDRATNRYAMPIKDNIDYTRGIDDLKKEKSEIYEEKLFDDIKDMMEGYYRSTGDTIEFRSKARKERKFRIPLHLTSSSVRGLSDLYFFLRHMARRDHLLIIDEPESHLDTANQILLARLLARLVRTQLKILITTHSDYLIKEINNLVMLSNFQNRPEVTKRLKYQEDDFIAPDSIRAYVAEKNSLHRSKVDRFGIDMPFFDRTIDDINRTSNDLASYIAEDEEM